MVIALIASAALAINEQDGALCGNDSSSSCSVVNNSAYAQFYGIKNSYWGTGIFLLMSILIFSHLRYPKKIKAFAINTGVLIGTIVALWFIYLQIFVIKAFCPYCLTVDGSVILSFLILFVFKRKRY